MAASPVFGTPVIVVDGYCFPDVSDETLNRKVQQRAENLFLFVDSAVMCRGWVLS